MIMKNRVRFDSDDLDFKEKRPGFADYLKRGVRWFLLSSLCAALFYVVFALIFSSDQDKRLMRESAAIEKEYGDMERQMEMLESIISELQTKDREIYQNLFNSEPPYLMPQPMTKELYSAVDNDTTDGLESINQSAVKLSELLPQAENVQQLISSLEQKTKDSIHVLKKIPCIIPVENFVLSQTGATIGKKMHPFYKTLTMHTGLDIVASVGTRVIASADGVVKAVVKSQRGKGNQVVIDHQNGYVTTYSHLSSISVRKGEKIKQGATIARVGTSGRVFAPHLHYEVQLHGEYQNPVDYFFVDLSPIQYREMLMISINTGQSMD